jgi:hypothetical protein
MKTKKKFYLASIIMILLSLIVLPINTANAGERSSTIQGTLISTGNSGTVSSYCTLGSEGLCSHFKYSCDADGVATMDSPVHGYGKIGDILWEGNAPKWVSCHLNAEMITRVASEKLRLTEMDGISGDMPERRLMVAQLLDAVADLVRDLALDADHDSELIEKDWQARLVALRDATFGVSYPPEDLHSRRGRVTVIE